MKVLMLYRPNSEHARVVEEFVRDFKRDNSERKVELVNIDSPHGIQLAELYDVVSYPACIAVANDGQLLKMWQGEQLPLMNELAYYAAN